MRYRCGTGRQIRRIAVAVLATVVVLSWSHDASALLFPSTTSATTAIGTAGIVAQKYAETGGVEVLADGRALFGDGDWAKYGAVAIPKDAKVFYLEAAGAADGGGGKIALHIDRRDGLKIGEITVPKGDGSTMKSLTAELLVAGITGSHDVYLVASGKGKVMAVRAFGLVSTAAATSGTAATTTAAATTATTATGESTAVTLTDAEKADLLMLREEEKLAGDLYYQFAKKGDFSNVFPDAETVFGQIRDSEERHQGVVAALLRQYGVPDPAAGREYDGVFTNQTIAKLYTDLLARGSTDVVAALSVGAMVEEKDIADVRAARQRTTKSDILGAYAALEAGSSWHLRAFAAAAAAKGGGAYAAQILSVTDVAAILAAEGGSTTIVRTEGVIESGVMPSVVSIGSGDRATATSIGTMGIDASKYTEMDGVVIDGVNGLAFGNGDWAMYKDVTIHPDAKVFYMESAGRANGGTIEFRIDSADGLKIAEIDVKRGDGRSFTLHTSKITVPGIAGVHSVYLVARGGAEVANIQDFDLLTADRDFSNRTVEESVAMAATNSASSITAADLATHNTATNCWVGYAGTVYDLSAFLPGHAGTAAAITPYCGTSTKFEAMLNAQHGAANAAAMLARYGTVKGTLAGTATATGSAVTSVPTAPTTPTAPLATTGVTTTGSTTATGSVVAAMTDAEKASLIGKIIAMLDELIKMLGSTTSSGTTAGATTYTDAPVPVLPPTTPRSAYAVIRALDYNAARGVRNASNHVGHFDNGDWMVYESVDFGTGGARSVSFSLAADAASAGGVIEVRLDGRQGTKIGELAVNSTGGWTTFTTQSASVVSVTGVHDVYLVADKKSNVANLQSFVFSTAAAGVAVAAGDQCVPATGTTTGTTSAGTTTGGTTTITGATSITTMPTAPTAPTASPVVPAGTTSTTTTTGSTTTTTTTNPSGVVSTVTTGTTPAGAGGSGSTTTGTTSGTATGTVTTGPLAAFVASWPTAGLPTNTGTGPAPAPGTLTGLKDSGPITVTQDGAVITGLKITGGGTCITVQANNVRITGNELSCGGFGVHVQGASNVTIDHNYMHEVVSGTLVSGTDGGIVFDHNYVVNVQGPFPRGQMIQFESGGGSGHKITCNVSLSEPGKANNEDHVNTWSVKFPDNGILVAMNKIKGDGPSGSDGGLLAGDGQSTGMYMRNNIVVNPGGYGIAVAGGQNNTLDGNLVFTGTCTGNEGCVALYVDDYSGGGCANNTIINNRTNGQFPRATWQDGGPCANTREEGNNYGDPLVTEAIWNLAIPQCGN